MMIALLEDDSWHYKMEYSQKGHESVHMYNRDLLSFKKMEKCEKKILKYTVQHRAHDYNSKIHVLSCIVIMGET